MPTNPKLVRDHFLAAAELPAAERAAYLTAHCGGDAELLAAVVRLLAAHDQPASVLNRPFMGCRQPTAAYVPSERPGTVIAGRYKLLEADRRRRHGYSLGGRADATRPPQGSSQAHQGRHGFEIGACPL